MRIRTEIEFKQAVHYPLRKVDVVVSTSWIDDRDWFETVSKFGDVRSEQVVSVSRVEAVQAHLAEVDKVMGE